MKDFLIRNGELLRYTGSEEAVTVPQNVKWIAASAFRGNKNLRSVWISETVEAVGAFAFADCTALKRISFYEGIKKISVGAFFGCSSLEYATIPKSVTEIAEDAFTGCEKLRFKTQAGSAAVTYGVRNSIPIDYAHDFVSFTVKDGMLTECICLEPEFRVPEGVTAIADSAFVGRIEKLTVPDSVTRLEGSPFHGLHKLNSIQLPDRLVDGLTFNQVIGLFTREFMNIPSKEFWLVSHALNGDFDGCPGLYRQCVDRLTHPFFSIRWINNSIQKDQPQWLQKILELNPEIPARKIEEAVRNAQDQGKAELAAILLAYNQRHQCPDTEFRLEEL